MKKIAAFLCVLAAAGTFAYAQNSAMSAGGGSLFSMSFASPGGSQEVTLQEIDSGVFIFFDAAYIEASVNIYRGTYKYTDTGGSDTLSQTNLGLAIFGKYPIDLGGITFFPLLGFESQVCITTTQPYNFSVAAPNFNALWFKAGLGCDYSLCEKLYLRTEILFGRKLNNSIEKEILKDNSPGVISFFMPGKKSFMSGPTVKIGVGCRL
ncbi:MAG: hypothetical protein LBC67_06520 [Spirochaetales bacterium]|jgi:hypothetical protein|nr:hypothetical protein [Spirochaetales bacterium]